MFGLGNSWFYLTLWRGTPPEFTTHIERTIDESNSALAYVKTADGMSSKIDTTASLSANIRSRETIGTEVITTTEVVWYVS